MIWKRSISEQRKLSQIVPELMLYGPLVLCAWFEGIVNPRSIYPTNFKSFVYEIKISKYLTDPSNPSLNLTVE